MRIQALDKYDNVEEGTVYDCPDAQAAKLIAKGLAQEVKSAPTPANKMAPPPENKANPSADGGRGQPSSASEAAPASREKTAQQYPGGGLVTPDPRIAAAETEQHEAAKKAPAKKAAKKAANRRSGG